MKRLWIIILPILLLTACDSPRSCYTDFQIRRFCISHTQSYDSCIKSIKDSVAQMSDKEISDMIEYYGGC